MRYRLIKPYPVFDVTAGEPLTSDTCTQCGRPLRLGEIRLRVNFVDEPPYPDAIAAMDGPEWAVSARLGALLRDLRCGGIELVPLVTDPGDESDFTQVVVATFVRAGRSSIRSGRPCDLCGQGAQLNSGPIFLAQAAAQQGPEFARLLENPYLVLIREDVAKQIADSAFDVELEDAYFDGETPARATQTFEGSDWSDL
jgi:hypothetical protein